MAHHDEDPFGLPPGKPDSGDPLKELEQMLGGLLADDARRESPRPPNSADDDASAETVAEPPPGPALEAVPEAVAREPEPPFEAVDTEPDDGPPAVELGALVAALDAEAGPPVLPQPAAESTDTFTAKRHILFQAGDTRYALEMGRVIEVGPVPPVTPLPRVPSWLLGVSNLRGDILAVLDFRAFLGHGDAIGAVGDRHRMLIVQSRDDRLTAGLVVDRVHGVGAVDPTTVRPPITAVEDPVHRYLHGVCEQDGRLLAVLDSEKLLTSDDLRDFSATPQQGLESPTDSGPVDPGPQATA